MTKAKGKPNAPELINRYIANLTDWRGKTLARIREVFHEADPALVEEWKWMGSPVFSHAGIICVANAHKDKIKLTFAQGAHLSDPHRIFNAGLGGGKWRAIDLAEGDKVDETALTELIHTAISYNTANSKEKVVP